MSRKWKAFPAASRQQPYHYTECGLDDVYLVNGFQREDTPYGEAVVIEDLEDLSRAIGRVLVTRRKTLCAKESRYLRKSMNLSQSRLASLLGVTDQTVARWEKDKAAVNPAAERLLRFLYCEFIRENKAVKALLDKLIRMDEEDDKLMFEDHDGHWRLKATEAASP